MIKRVGKKAYVLTPISEDDLYFSPEMLDHIKEAQQEIKDRETHTFANAEELDKHIRSL